ncbi:MAG: ACP S-malonyltransferase, partial [Terrimesophilobacter sp.]
MIIVVCPGQGSQTPGFLQPWLDLAGLAERLETYSGAAGIDLARHGTVSDADTIRDTAVAQPLIVAAGLLTLSVLLEGRRDRIGGIAGHSVGELTAAAGAGILAENDAVSLVAERGRAMADAAAITPTGMSAVVGADETELLDTLVGLGLDPANFNGGGQIVVAGALDALAQLKENPPAGARVIPLQVAGAFHTRYMAPAVERLSTAASALVPSNPTVPIWTNRDGSRVTGGQEYLDLIVGQVSSPVRWDKTMESFLAAQ